MHPNRRNEDRMMDEEDDDAMDLAQSPSPFGQETMNSGFRVNNNPRNFNRNIISTNNLQKPKFRRFNVQGDTFVLTNRYDLSYFLGNGAYGTVVAGFDKITKKKVAIKKVHNVFNQSFEYQKRIYREVKILQHFNHENIIKLVDLVPCSDFNSFKDVYIVFELMETDLRQIINSTQKLTDAHIQFFLYQILKAVKNLHSASVLHRDLKPENILLNSDCDLKLCDFGLARGVDLETENFVMSTPYVATRYYRSPELLLMWEGTSKAIDMWSIGCIFAELILRKVLFPGKNYLHQLDLIMNVLGTPKKNQIRACEKAQKYLATLQQKRPKNLYSIFPRGTNPVGIQLLSRMLTFDPLERITVEQALNHKYLSNLHDDSDEPSSVPFNFGFEKVLKGKKVNLKLEIFKEIQRWNRSRNNTLM